MKRIFWSVLFITILFLYVGISSAAGQLDIQAPHGGEYDLGQNVMKYYGTVSHLVEARWKESSNSGEELLVQDGKSAKKPSSPSLESS